MKKLKGFTLAEGLITLTICGIVAVVALPGLMAKRDIVEHHAHLQKAYAELNDFASYFQANHSMTASEYYRINGSTEFYKEFGDYLATMSKVSDWRHDSDSSVTKPYDFYTLKTHAKQNWLCDTTGIRSDSLGRLISFDDAPLEGYNGPRICIDTNGPKGPNTFGIDIFSFLFTVDGEVIPDGQEHPKNYYGGQGPAWSAGALKGAENCYNSNDGLNCAYYAINDISPLDSSRTYWEDYIGRKDYQK